MTFWGDNLFVGKNGKAVPNGLTVRRAVVRQVNPTESEWIARVAKNLGRVVLLTFTILLLAARLFRADTFPLWSVVNTIILVVHFPLLNLQLPGNLSLFLREFLNILRLKDLDLEQWLEVWGVTHEYDPASISDRGHNIFFEQLGYDSKFFVKNCTHIIAILALFTMLCVIAYFFELIRKYRSMGSG